MRKKLLSRLSQMNSDLEALKEQLSSYSHDELNKKPTPDSWSALQALYHLYLSEGYGLSYCVKKLNFNPDVKKAGIMAYLRSALVVTYLNSPVKFKAPKPVSSEAIPNTIEWSDFMDNWQNQRSQLREFLEKVPEKHLYTELYKHPFGGRLSLWGMLSFLQAHWKRHRKQALRALSN